MCSLFKLKMLFTCTILFTQDVDDIREVPESFIIYTEDLLYIELFTWNILLAQDADDMLEALELSSSCVDNIFHVNDKYYLH